MAEVPETEEAAVRREAGFNPAPAVQEMLQVPVLVGPIEVPSEQVVTAVHETVRISAPPRQGIMRIIPTRTKPDREGQFHDIQL
ncbi:MAG: hypothetical protein OHK0028_18170 [Deltaproteobacteria bacterium]